MIAPRVSRASCALRALRPLRRQRQRGVALLGFALIATVVVLTIVLSLSSVLARKASATLYDRQQAYVDDVAFRINALYMSRAESLDSSAGAPDLTPAAVQQLASPEKWGVRVVMSSKLEARPGGASGPLLRYRRFLVYLPSDTDDRYPPDLSRFEAEGVFVSCTAPDGDCGRRIYAIVDGQSVQSEMLARTKARLTRLAAKGGAYFKARYLEAGEKSLAINFFRPQDPGCVAFSYELPCVDVETPLAQANVQKQLGLAPEDLVNAWGGIITLITLPAAPNTSAPPYSMLFRTTDPFGNTHQVFAVQPL